jgi:hypothetical protein
LPEPQEVLVAKEINISPPYNNRQVYKFPLEETAPKQQKVEPTFNRVSRQIAVEELPESTLPAKQFTYKAEPNFNKFSPKTSEKQIGAKKIISRETQLPGAVKQISAKSDQSELEIKEKIRRLLSKTGNLVDLIASNPEAFLNNLIGGLKLGFKNFFTNIRSHLQNALISWLTGTLGSIQMPPAGTPTVKGFFSIVLQVLGITWPYIRTKAVAQYKETMVNRMEQSVKIFQQVKERPMEMWDHVKNLIQGQQQGLIEEVKTTVVNTVIVQLINKFISLLTPAAGVRALMTVYNILKFFIEKCHQVMELVTAVIDAVKAIAEGKMAGIASSVEKALSRSLPVLIGTLAATLGIESVAAKIRGLISKMQNSIDTTIDYFVRKVRNLVPPVNQSKEGGQTLRSRNPDSGRVQTSPRGQSNAPDNRTHRQKIADLDKAVADSENVMNEDGATPYSVNEKLPNIRTNYRLSSLRLHRVRGNIHFVRAIINPQKDSRHKKLVVFNRGEWDVGHLIAERKGNGWSNPLQITAITINDQEPAESYFITAKEVQDYVPRGREPLKLTISSKTYGVRWRRTSVDTSFKQGQAWERIKNLNEWSNFADARQTLNHRYHNDFRNPQYMQWHHIIEQSVNGPNSVENLALTTGEINRAISNWFNIPHYGTGGKRLRDFLASQSRKIQRFWGEEAIKAMGLKIVKRNNNRGVFQQLVPK